MKKDRNILSFLSVLSIIYIFSNIKYAHSFDRQVIFYGGMQNISFTENSSGAEASSDGEEATQASGSISQMSLMVDFHFLPYLKKSVFLRAAVPLQSSSKIGSFMGLIGINFYFRSLSTNTSLRQGPIHIKFEPITSYYWGLTSGINYLVYPSGTATKSDTSFLIGVHGGMTYRISKKYGIVGELDILKGTGIATNSFNTSFYIGMNYFF